MNIAIDITPLSSGHEGRGIGMYTKELMKALSAYGSKHSYIFIEEKGLIPENADIIHYPYFDPFFLTLPMRINKPTVVTVHDLIPLVFPSHFKAGLKGRIKWEMQKMSLKNKTRILADSETTKKDIVDIVGFSKDRIDVSYLAPSESFRPVDKKIRERIQKKYNLQKDYFLYVGDINWNKNVLGLLHAFSKYLFENPQTTLMLVGKAFLGSTSEAIAIDREIKKLSIDAYIERPGFVDEHDLKALYAGASAFIMPSFYEGFGLPVLEAFACGCPVICSDTSSLKEISGPAMRISPTDIDSITEAMKAIAVLSKVNRKAEIAKGRAWAKRFSWKKVAEDAIASYEKACAFYGDKV